MSERGISIKESIIIFIYTFTLHVLFYLPFAALNHFLQDRNLNRASNQVQFWGGIIAYLCLVKFLYLKNNCKLKLGYKPKIKEYIYMFLFVIGYNLMRDNIFTFFYNLNLDNIMSIYSSFFELDLISSILIAPVFEEIIFRGFFLKQLSLKYSKVTAIIISSLYFGIFHFKIYQGISAFIFGIVIAWIYLKSNSLLLCIFVHSISNLYYSILENHSIAYKNIMVEFNIFQLLLGLALLVVAYNLFKASLQMNRGYKNNY